MSDRPKHIVIDARNRRASTGRYTDRLVENLQDIDKTSRYAVLVEPDDDWQMRNRNFQTVPCRFQQFSFNPLDQIAFAWQLYRLRADLVHFTMTQQPLFYLGKTVTTTHDLSMLRHTRASRFPKWLHAIGMVLYRMLFRWAHLKSAKIVVPSQFVAEDLAKYQPFTKKKTVVIHEAADPPIDGKAEALRSVQKPFIFHVGAPYPHKNIDRLIKAFELLKKTQPELQLVLPGKARDQFKRDFDRWVGASPARNSIIAPGFVSDAQLKWLYENAEAYVLPSLSEGFGLPGLEAMAHGCPVVSSNATCLPEIYGVAAEYFNPGNVEEIAKAIEKVLLSTKLQEKLREKGKEQLKKYSWSKMAQETLEIYKVFL
jgi:glycosyltransferase involved in cell wall biosynthesis